MPAGFCMTTGTEENKICTAPGDESKQCFLPQERSNFLFQYLHLSMIGDSSMEENSQVDSWIWVHMLSCSRLAQRRAGAQTSRHTKGTLWKWVRGGVSSLNLCVLTRHLLHTEEGDTWQPWWKGSLQQESTDGKRRFISLSLFEHGQRREMWKLASLRNKTTGVSLQVLPLPLITEEADRPWCQSCLFSIWPHSSLGVNSN